MNPPEHPVPVDPRLLTVLSELGFSPPVSTSGRLSVADLFPRTKRRGLYVLHAGDEHYLGLTENVARRYREHLERHPDVQALSFRAVARGDLRAPERASIQQLERQGVTLRNSAEMSLPAAAGSDLDDLVPPEDQQAWLAGAELPWSGRSRDEAVRRRQERTWQTFRARPGADTLLALVERYVRRCVIAPGRTELGLWSVTCFAKGGFRVNAGWQEVFRTLDGEDFFLLVAPSVLEQQLGRGWTWHLQSLGIAVREQLYVFPGHDNAGLFVWGAASAGRLLDMPAVSSAARTLCYRCMRKAPNPNSRSHAPQLVEFLDQNPG